MLYIRSFIFTSWFILLTAFVCISGMLFMPFPSKYLLAYVRLWSKMIVWGANFFAGIKLNVEGLDNLPKQGPYIIACKHQSAFDTLIFHSFLPEVCFLHKVEMSRVPCMGQVLQKLEFIPVDRKHGTQVLRKVVTAACERLKKGKIIAIFPEGTRVAPNQHVKYSHGVSMIYSISQVPIVPAAINSGYLWPRNSFTKKSGTVTLRFLEPILPGKDKKAVMEELENRIENACMELPNPCGEEDKKSLLK